MYEKYYYTIIKNTFNKSLNNSHILFINNNYFDINEEFKYIIKLKNINVYILNNDNLIYNKLQNNVEGEECNKLINIYNNNNDLNEYIKKNNIILNNIVIFHIYSIDYLTKISTFCNDISTKNTLIYIYCSLSNSNELKIQYKNYIRDKIKSIFTYKIGTLLNFSDVLNNLENNININIKSINIYKKSNYIIYGDNIVYKIILMKI